MSGYGNILQQFQSSILEEDAAPALPLITDKPGFPPEEQMDIYIRAYRMRLSKAVESEFPATQYALGKAAFAALVKEYIAATPSTYFNLDTYPYKFAAYVKARSGDAFAHDVAALEGAINEVYAMEESVAVDAAWLASLSMETLAETRLLPRRACKLLALSYPANRWLLEFREQKNPAHPASEKTFVAVWRHQHNVKRRDMEALEFALFSRLAEGKPIGEALEAVALPESLPAEQFLGKLQHWFTEWVNAGLIRDPKDKGHD